MADLPDGQSQPQPQPAPITVNAQYLKDLSFESPNAPLMVLNNSKPPQVGVSVDIGIADMQHLNLDGRNGHTFEVTLSMRAEAKLDDKTVFLVECAYAGLLTLQGIPEEHQQEVLMIEGPRLLFPFARSIISDATRDGGFPPLLVNPIDFVMLFRQYTANRAAEAEKPQPANTLN